jgi:hypothetical protein
MEDPLTLVATGAAVGGAAGKFVEKAWDCGERWLRERFGSHTEVAQKRARENAAEFVHHLAIRVHALEVEASSSGRSVGTGIQDPQFSVLLQKSILNAAQTSDEQKQRILAELVGKRLFAEEESTLALASQLASDAIAHSNRRQLEVMAFLVFVDEIRPRDPYPTAQQFKTWLEVHLQPFTNMDFEEIDAKHLVAISCASYDPTSERSLPLFLAMKAGEELIGELHSDTFKDVKGVDYIQICWNLGIAGIQLTSVGSIVGGLALEDIRRRNLTLPRN